MSEAAKIDKEVWNVSALRIARVYAEALLNAAEQANQVDAVLEDLGALVQDVIHADPRITALFSGAGLGRKAREEVLEKTFQSRASALIYHFLHVLNDHERLDLLSSINREIRVLHDVRAKRLHVHVFSAVPLDDEQRARIETRVRDRFHIEPALKEHVDPTLLGGLRVRIGDQQLDSTVRTRLDNLRQQLIARSSHEIQSGRDRFSSAV